VRALTRGGCVSASNFKSLLVCLAGYSQIYILAMNLNTLARVTAHNQNALREGLKIVRNVVASNPYPAGFTTAELFKLVAKQTPPKDFKALKLPSRPASNPKTKSGSKRIPAPLPPRPNHPIKSMTCVHNSVCVCFFLLTPSFACSFLKRSVLPILEGNKELQMVRTTRIPFNPASVASRTGGKRKGKQEASHAASAAAPAPVTVWVWKPVDKSKLPRPPAPKPQRKAFGVEVGVGTDWSHLNKRRRRARVGKVGRDVSSMKVAMLVRGQKARARTAMARTEALKATVRKTAETSASGSLEAKRTRSKKLEEAKVSASVVKVSSVVP
jgi:hypothetical protein